MKKYTLSKITAVFLITLLVFNLMGCAERSNIAKNGISIESNPPYSEKTQMYAKQTILSLARYACGKASPFDTISEKLEARLSGYANSLSAIMAQKPIDEAKYLLAMETLMRDGEGAIDELFAFDSGSFTECEKIRRLYLDLTYIFGSEYLASMLYDVSLFVYDIKYERAMEKFERYAYPWLKEEADAIALEKSVFSQGIDRENFSALIRCATAFAELFSGGINSLSDTFSDEELLEMIKTMDLDEIDIKKNGWELLISYVYQEDSLSGNSSYQEKLRYTLKSSGDGERVAEVMNEAMTLMVSVMKKLTHEDLKALREGDFETATVSIFSCFSESDWQLFSIVTAVELSNASYSSLALAEYGDSYSDYLASLKNVSFTEVYEALGEEDFYEILSDYLVEICPAISYEVNK